MRVRPLERYEGPKFTTMTNDPSVACFPTGHLMSLFGQAGVIETVLHELLGHIEDLQSVVRVGRRSE